MDAKEKLGALSYLDRADLPFYYALADAYTICDAYFCSGADCHRPNRAYLWSGSIDAEGSTATPHTTAARPRASRWPPMRTALEEAGHRWRVYQKLARQLRQQRGSLTSRRSTTPPSIRRCGSAAWPTCRARTGSTRGHTWLRSATDVVNGHAARGLVGRHRQATSEASGRARR
jgi:phospholipase C